MLLQDLQLLLQTSNGNGGASRPACALKTIAVAVEMARDPKVNFKAPHHLNRSRLIALAHALAQVLGPRPRPYE